MNAPIRIMISLLNYRASLHLEEKTLWIVAHVSQEVYFPPKLNLLKIHLKFLFTHLPILLLRAFWLIWNRTLN